MKTISISRWDGSRWVFAGRGFVDGGVVRDCPAILGDHSADVYGCIEGQLGAELQEGEVIDPDGVRYSWELM